MIWILYGNDNQIERVVDYQKAFDMADDAEKMKEKLTEAQMTGEWSYYLISWYSNPFSKT